MTIEGVWRNWWFFLPRIILNKIWFKWQLKLKNGTLCGKPLFCLNCSVFALLPLHCQHGPCKLPHMQTLKEGNVTWKVFAVCVMLMYNMPYIHITFNGKMQFTRKHYFSMFRMTDHIKHLLNCYCVTLIRPNWISFLLCATVPHTFRLIACDVQLLWHFTERRFCKVVVRLLLAICHVKVSRDFFLFQLKVRGCVTHSDMYVGIFPFSANAFWFM